MLDRITYNIYNKKDPECEEIEEQNLFYIIGIGS